MKVRFYQAELFIEPETDFEEEVLSKFHNCTSILKSGLSLAETKGILIRQECKPPKEKAECANSTPNNASDEICEMIAEVCAQDNVNCSGDIATCRLRKLSRIA